MMAPAMSRPARTVRCSRCGVTLSLPPAARGSVRCTICGRVTVLPRTTHDSVRTAVSGLVRSIVGALTTATAFSSPPPPASSSSLPPSFPRVYGRKRALLIGIGYAGRSYALRGTLNDVNCMRCALCERFGFPSDCVLVLTDEERDPSRVPTKANMRAAMRWLVDGAVAGDSLVLHFSGHGVQKLDCSGDEVDGYDEALCPVDFEEAGVILDDEINDAVVRPVPAGAKLHAVVDTCHSGTVLDLPYLCRIRAGYWQWEDHRPRSGKYKGTSGGLAVLISGCDDNQTSADTTAFAGNTTTGAMTYSFLQALELEPRTTYGMLLATMRGIIRDKGGNGAFSGPIASLIRRVITFGSTQEPQLSSSEIFDIYKKPFLL